MSGSVRCGGGRASHALDFTSQFEEKFSPRAGGTGPPLAPSEGVGSPRALTSEAPLCAPPSSAQRSSSSTTSSSSSLYLSTSSSLPPPPPPPRS
ncbi:unnamed protein product [Lampetra planeri]